jgi:kynurenine formamidase
MSSPIRLSSLLLVLAACTAAPDVDAVFDGRAGEWIDLTHPFDSASIYWPTADGFVLEDVAYGRTEAGFFYAANTFSAAEHGGTHLDAPIHFAEGRHAADAIPLERLIGPAAVVDVSDRAHEDYLITVADLEAWEAAHGRIPDGAILLIRTGWEEHYGDRTRYLGTGATGPDAVPLLHFPGIDPEAARWLVAERAIDAIGIDTPSIDYGQSSDFASHVALYDANIPGFENVTNLSRLPATGAFVVALPMKIAGGSGGPLRIVAFVPAE